LNNTREYFDLKFSHDSPKGIIRQQRIPTVIGVPLIRMIVKGILPEGRIIF